MKDVSYGVRELQAHIGDALRAVQRGERVLVTSRKRVVAVLSKADAELRGEGAVERKLRRLVVEGKLRLGKRGPIPAHALPPGIEGLTDRVRADRR
jgi:prevent-host-death family protein